MHRGPSSRARSTSSSASQANREDRLLSPQDDEQSPSSRPNTPSPPTTPTLKTTSERTDKKLVAKAEPEWVLPQLAPTRKSRIIRGPTPVEMMDRATAAALPMPWRMKHRGAMTFTLTRWLSRLLLQTTRKKTCTGLGDLPHEAVPAHLEPLPPGWVQNDTFTKGLHPSADVFDDTQSEAYDMDQSNDHATAKEQMQMMNIPRGRPHLPNYRYWRRLWKRRQSQSPNMVRATTAMSVEWVKMRFLEWGTTPYAKRGKPLAPTSSPRPHAEVDPKHPQALRRLAAGMNKMESREPMECRNRHASRHNTPVSMNYSEHEMLMGEFRTTLMRTTPMKRCGPRTDGRHGSNIALIGSASVPKKHGRRMSTGGDLSHHNDHRCLG